MARLVDERRTFRVFPYARCATVVMFQQANLPSGNVAEGKNTTAANTTSMVSRLKSPFFRLEILLSALNISPVLFQTWT